MGTHKPHPTAAPQDSLSYRRILGSRTAHNTVGQYAVFIANQLLPVATVSLLARTLSAEGWGQLILIQSFASIFTVCTDYGFSLSASRDIAKHRSSPTYQASLVSSVLYAKVILSAFALAVGVILRQVIPEIRHLPPQLFWFATLAAILQGFQLAYYFQGTEQLVLFGFITMGTSALALILTFIVVRSPSDNWRFAAVQAAAWATSLGLSVVLIRRDVAFTAPSVDPIKAALVSGWRTFTFKTGFAIYSGINPFLLGFTVNATEVGLYGGAEKLIKALTAALTPLSSALYPRITRAVSEGDERVLRHRKATALLVLGVGGTLSLVPLLLPQDLIRILLGQRFVAATPLLRLFSLMPLLVAGTQVLAYQMVLPKAEVKYLNRIVVGSLLIDASIILLFGHSIQGKAAMVGALCSELFVILALGLIAARSKPEPIAPWNRGIRSVNHSLKNSGSNPFFQRNPRSEYVVLPHPLKLRMIRAYARSASARILIETGTFRGDTVAATRGYFDRIVSIELDAGLHRAASDRFANDPNVEILLGDCVQVIPTVLDALQGVGVILARWPLERVRNGSNLRGDEPILRVLEEIGNPHDSNRQRPHLRRQRRPAIPS